MFTRIKRIGVAATILFILGGCLKRTEVLVVHPDGSLTMYAAYQGDTNDVQAGDALPTQETGWLVSDQTETNDKGEQTTTRLALGAFSTAARVPTTYAEPGTEAELAALRYTTDLTVESRPDGRYYHFRRTYHRRAAHQLGYLRERFLESEALKKIGAKPPEQLNDGDRQALANAFLDHAAARAEMLVELAFDRLTKPVEQDSVLAVARSASAVYGPEDLRQRVAVMLAGDDADGAAAELEASLKRAEAAAIADALASQRISPPIRGQFWSALDLLRAAQAVTEDIGDEEWTVITVLPGRVINLTRRYADGPVSPPDDDLIEVPPSDDWPQFHDEVAALTREVQATASTIGAGVCTWTFPGQALYDREVVLRATSVVVPE